MKRKRRSAKSKPKQPSPAADVCVDPENYSDVNRDNGGLHVMAEVAEIGTRQLNTGVSSLHVDSNKSVANNRTAASAAAKLARTLSSSHANTVDRVPLQRERIGEKAPKSSRPTLIYNKQELDAARSVIEEIMKMDAAIPFNAPVDPIALGIPDYFDIIDTPMDFGTICSSLQKGLEYRDAEDVLKDVQRIWDNCCKYNKKGSYILELMNRVKNNFMKQWTAAGLNKEQPAVSNDDLSRNPQPFAESTMGLGDVHTYHMGSSFHQQQHNSAYFNQGQHQQTPPCCNHTYLVPQHNQYTHLHPVDPMIATPINDRMNKETPGLMHSYQPSPSGDVMVHPHQRSYHHQPSSSNFHPSTHLHPVDPMIGNPSYDRVNKETPGFMHSYQPSPSGDVMVHPHQRAYHHQPSSSNFHPVDPMIGNPSNNRVNKETPGIMHSYRPSPSGDVVVHPHQRAYHHQPSSSHLHPSTHLHPVDHMIANPRDNSVNKETPGLEHSYQPSPIRDAMVHPHQKAYHHQPSSSQLHPSKLQAGIYAPRTNTGHFHLPQREPNSTSNNDVHAIDLGQDGGDGNHSSPSSVPAHQPNNTNTSRGLHISDAEGGRNVDSAEFRTGGSKKRMKTIPYQGESSHARKNDRIDKDNFQENMDNTDHRMGRSKTRMKTVPYQGESSNAQEVERSDTDTSQQNIDNDEYSSENVQKRKRGKTVLQEVWDLPSNRRILVEANERGQPVGDNAKKFVAFIGLLARDHCPLNYESWLKVPQETKNDLVTTLREKFSYPSTVDSWVRKEMGRIWRNYKCYLKEKYFYDQKSEEFNFRNCPSDVKADQWKYLVSFWMSDKGKKLSEINKRSRACLRTSHTTGSKSFARKEHEIIVETGKRPGMIKLTEVTHMRKDGTFVDSSIPALLEEAKAEKAKRSATRTPSTDTKMEEVEIMCNLTGPIRNGRVRGFGLGPTAKTIFGHRCPDSSTNTNEEFNNLQRLVLEQGEQIKSLHDKLARLMQHIMPTRDGIVNPATSDDRQMASSNSSRGPPSAGKG